MSDLTDKTNLAEHGNRTVQAARNQSEFTHSVHRGQREAGMTKQCMTEGGNQGPG